MEAFRRRFSDETGLKDPDDPDDLDDLDCLDKAGKPFTLKEETVFVKVEWDSSTDPARDDPLSARLEAAEPMKLESESSIQSDSCGIYNCDQCNFSSGAKKDLKRHLESVHHVIFTSDNEAKISAAKSRGIHAEVGSDGRLHYHCTYCDYKSVRNDTIKSHIDRKHLGVKPYSPTKPHHKKDKVCLQCDYTTDQGKHLTRHMEASHGEQPSREVVFARLNEAEAHGVVAEEQEGGVISYSCDICGHRGKSLSTIRSHRTRKHRMEKHQDRKQILPDLPALEEIVVRTGNPIPPLEEIVKAVYILPPETSLYPS